MFGSVVLDVAIGMAFIYLLMSLIASVVQEIGAAILQLRPANLLRGVRSLVSGDSMWGKDLVDSLYNHGLIRGLYSDPVHDELMRPAQSAAKAAAYVAENDAQTHAQAEARASAAGVAARAQTGNGGLATELENAKQAVQHALARAMASGRMADRAVDALEEARRAAANVSAPWGLRARLRELVGFPNALPVNGISNQALLPAYIPSRTFALALTDILNANKEPAERLMASVTQTLADHCRDEENKAAQALYALAIDAKGDVAKFQRNVENWYNDSMDRASGWYKKYVQRILLVLGVGLAVFFNVDSVRVAQTLWFDRDTRQEMANAADAYVKEHPRPAADGRKGAAGTAAAGGDDASQGSVGGEASPDAPAAGNDKAAGAGEKTPSTEAALEKKLRESADAFNAVTKEKLLPVGWKQTPLEYFLRGCRFLGRPGVPNWFGTLMNTVWRCLELLLGWMITGIAISLGAPFWFDTLNKFMVVRSTVKPQEKSRNEGSKD